MANNYLWIEGIPFPTTTVGDLRSWGNQFVVRDEDVIILSYPKSGKKLGSQVEGLGNQWGDFTLVTQQDSC